MYLKKPSRMSDYHVIPDTEDILYNLCNKMERADTMFVRTITTIPTTESKSFLFSFNKYIKNLTSRSFIVSIGHVSNHNQTETKIQTFG